MGLEASNIPCVDSIGAIFSEKGTPVLTLYVRQSKGMSGSTALMAVSHQNGTVFAVRRCEIRGWLNKKTCLTLSEVGGTLHDVEISLDSVPSEHRLNTENFIKRYE